MAEQQTTHSGSFIPADDGCVITTSELTRRFGRIAAVNGISLAVPRGSVYGFLGPNGAGKTTTIRMLLGLLRPDGGEVQLFGRPFRQNRLASLARTGALVEEPSLYPHLTGRENLELIQRLCPGQPANIEKTLELVGLSADARRRVRTYSQGMRQRLGLACALLREPELLILDEPTNGLDPAGIHEIRHLIRRLPEAGTTIFLSSHLLSEVEQMATHIGIIQRGYLVFQGTLPQLHARTEPRLMLETDRPAAARQLLAGRGYQAAGNGNGSLHVPVASPADAAAINRLLVENGLAVHHLVLQRPTLEDIFLSFTAKHHEEPGWTGPARPCLAPPVGVETT